jgi:hypothetical protein
MICPRNDTFFKTSNVIIFNAGTKSNIAHWSERAMKVGDRVVLSGLIKTKHLNGKLASIIKKHDTDRWIVKLDGAEYDEVNS